MKVVHGTCSFDIGGTQKQIIYLCREGNRKGFHHETVEIFPEHNYLYRTEEKVIPEQYVQGCLLAKALGFLTRSPSTRSWQVVQVYKFFCDFQNHRKTPHRS